MEASDVVLLSAAAAAAVAGALLASGLVRWVRRHVRARTATSRTGGSSLVEQVMGRGVPGCLVVARALMKVSRVRAYGSEFVRACDLRA